MSQSATLYRISNDTFKQFASAGGNELFDLSAAKGYATFQGSFMGLAFILIKQQDEVVTAHVSEIFNPTQSLGNQPPETLSPEELFDFFENNSSISYIDPATVNKIDMLLKTMSAEDIRQRFNADELNDNGIYPKAWHDDNSPDQAFNQRHVEDDFVRLKEVLQRANEEKDYIFVFIG